MPKVVITAAWRVWTVQKAPPTVDIGSRANLQRKGIADAKAIAEVTPGLKVVS